MRITNSVDRIADSHVLRLAALGLATAFALLTAYWGFFFLPKMISWQDTWQYWKGARAILDHRAPYGDLPGWTPENVPGGYLYWPQLAVLLAPVSTLGPIAFSKFWVALNLVAFWVFAGSLSAISQGRTTVRGTLIWGLVTASIPAVYHCLSTRNADTLLWAFIGLAFASRRTAAWLAVAAQMKTYAVLTLALYIWQNRSKWREAATVLCAGFALSLFAGFDWPVRWFRAVAAISQGTFWHGNVSLSMAGLRLLRATGWWHYNGGAFPLWAHVWVAAWGVAIQAVSFFLCLRLRTPYRYPVLLCMSALAQPLCWEFYLTSGLIVVAMLIRDKQSGGKQKEAPVKPEPLIKPLALMIIKD